MNQILVEAKKMTNSNGNVWLWKSETVDGVRHFLTVDDAQKYIELLNQFSRENGRPEEAFSIGMEADFMAAAQKFERKKKANEVKEYCKHVDELIEHKRREIKALGGLMEVCRQFDGKVLNKRFCDAVREATGFLCSFAAYSFEFEIFDYNTDYRPCASIPADWSHGRNSITGEKKKVDPNTWRWNKGERLEAEKAVAVIEYWKNYRLQAIQELAETKKQYAAYLKLARKAEQIFKEIDGYDYSIREFARNHALSQYNYLTKFWRTY